MSYYRIDGHLVAQQISQQELKYWWVAEQAGIHKTTLRRWLSGRIERIREDHAQSLARVLTVPIQQIAVPTN